VQSVTGTQTDKQTGDLKMKTKLERMVMYVIEVQMCSNRRHLFITTMVSVNINGERHRIYTYSVQYSQIAIFFNFAV